ncbi:MAG: hypothetical protein M0015_05830 [Betaproteobacteria bacterium]|nr:hypothetical protein [Betaproteobacteria bacterium]
MESSEHYVPQIEQASRDLEACEVHILEQRVAARALREDPGARAYARRVAHELAVLVERYASPNGRLTQADALDETLAEDIVRLAMQHRHALLSQPVSDEGFRLLKHKVWEASAVLEHFLPARSFR